MAGILGMREIGMAGIRGIKGRGGIRIGWDIRDFRDERDRDGRDTRDKRERRMPVERRAPSGRAARPFAAAVPCAMVASGAGMREIGIAAGIRGIKGREGIRIGWDIRDFRDERDRDGRDTSDKRERRMPVESRAPSGRAARPFAAVMPRKKGEVNSRTRELHLSCIKSLQKSSKVTKNVACVLATHFLPFEALYSLGGGRGWFPHKVKV